MVQRNGTREASGTRLITLLACTSKNVMPRKPGVSNVRATAPRSNRAGAPAEPAGASGVSRIPSQRMMAIIEHVFELGKRLFEMRPPPRLTGGRHRAGPGRLGRAAQITAQQRDLRLTILLWGIVRESPLRPGGGGSPHGAIHG